MKFPSIQDVARALARINANIESVDGEPIDVRLQVEDDGNWNVHTGDASFDTDHHGYWGSGSVPGVCTGVVRRLNSRELAKDLLDQCKFMHAHSDDGPASAHTALAPMFHHCTGLATCETCRAQAKAEVDAFVKEHFVVVHVGDSKGGR